MGAMRIVGLPVAMGNPEPEVLALTPHHVADAARASRGAWVGTGIANTGQTDPKFPLAERCADDIAKTGDTASPKWQLLLDVFII